MKKLVLVALLAGCGIVDEIDKRIIDRTNEVVETRTIEVDTEEVKDLRDLQAQLLALVSSNFKLCDSLGEAADPLINKICLVSQGANSESQVEIKAELSRMVNSLTNRIDALTIEAAAGDTEVDAEIIAVNAEIDALQSDLSDIAADLSDAEASISALEALTASISGTLNSILRMISIGSENLGAGPMYEVVLRRADKASIIAYSEDVDATLTLGSNPVTAVSGSNVLTVAATAHGLSVGQLVKLSGLTGGRGISAANLVGDFVVQSVPNANSFTILVIQNANANGTLGGNTGFAERIGARGLSEMWQTADGADVAARLSRGGSKPYNFIVKANGDICYSKINANASFAVINAGGVNVVCK